MIVGSTEPRIELFGLDTNDVKGGQDTGYVKSHKNLLERAHGSPPRVRCRADHRMSRRGCWGGVVFRERQSEGEGGTFIY